MKKNNELSKLMVTWILAAFLQNSIACNTAQMEAAPMPSGTYSGDAPVYPEKQQTDTAKGIRPAKTEARPTRQISSNKVPGTEAANNLLADAKLTATDASYERSKNDAEWPDAWKYILLGVLTLGFVGIAHFVRKISEKQD